MRLAWIRGHERLELAPALQLTTYRWCVLLRFGLDGRPLLSERYDGQHGFAKTHWYGPRGLTLIVRPVYHWQPLGTHQFTDPACFAYQRPRLGTYGLHRRCRGITCSTCDEYRTGRP